MDVSLTGDQEVAGLNPPDLQHSFVETDHEKIFLGHSLPSVDSRRAVVSFLQKVVHKYWLTS